jgi:hypothetical protein
MALAVFMRLKEKDELKDEEEKGHRGRYNQEAGRRKREEEETNQ